MRRRKWITAVLGACMLAACTQTDHTQAGTESTEPPSDASAAQVAIHGNLKQCDPLASGGAATGDGYYYTALRPDGNLNIRYLDYATLSDIILCSSPNCTHSDESCGSFIHSNGLVPSLAVVGGKLLIVSGGISVSEPEEYDLPYIETMQLDGNDRKRIYQADASSEFGALLCDDENFYTVERITSMQDDLSTLTQHLIQINLETGQKAVLSDLGTDLVYLCDAAGSTVYYYSIEPQDDAQTYSKTIFQYYAYDLETNNAVLLDTILSDSGRKIAIANGNLYQMDSEAHQILVKRIEDGTVVKEFPLDTELDNYQIRCVVDDKLIVDEQRKAEDGTIQSVTHTVDCSTGEMESWPLYYDSPEATHPMQAEILAVQDDNFLVRCGTRTLDVESGDSETDTMTIPNYAMMQKSDFWNGTENYRNFT